MDVDDRLAGRFEASRPRLRAMAYRMLGSLSDADNAVQEGWLHAARATARGGADDVANLEGWFTTIVARVCLDMLRSRKSRREEPLDPDDATVGGGPGAGGDAGQLGRARAAGGARHAPARRTGGVRAARHVRPAVRRDRLHHRPVAGRGSPAGQPGASPDPGRPARTPTGRGRAPGPSAPGDRGLHGRLARRRPGGPDRRAGPRRGAALGRDGIAVRRPADGARRGRGGRRGAGRFGALQVRDGSPWSTGLPA